MHTHSLGEGACTRWMTLDDTHFPDKRSEGEPCVREKSVEGSNIFDSIVMVMIRWNVKFMKCTEQSRITNTCSAANVGGYGERITDVRADVAVLCSNCFFLDS